VHLFLLLFNNLLQGLWVCGEVAANTLAQDTRRQTATVDHADIRGLGTTGLHYVAELAFL
jgi:hypothetical protein